MQNEGSGKAFRIDPAGGFAFCDLVITKHPQTLNDWVRHSISKDESTWTTTNTCVEPSVTSGFPVLN